MAVLTEESIAFGKILWDYHHVNHDPAKSDCILVLGSHDIRVAERGAELFLQGLAPLLVFSGGLGNLTQGIWDEPEAERFARVAVNLGVPEAAILIENKSTNTGENILFTGRLLRDKGLDPVSFLVVQKPYMERRSYATIKRHWPDRILLVTSPQIAFEDYPQGEITLEQVMHIMVGDLQRIRLYPERGYQIFQEIPGEVWRAWKRLVELGFDGHLLR